ncbi:uncharacterized protein LOC129238886 [Anastrepha obliqua]|uniref:uncharacterized protein LOC129238886 n=1 Tax=Anastrepha obliqua TaxID=95512 RepID=UPI00240A7FE8|nr:uncharacterized protein LOC129238886 [Anastrepha obliqua]
MARFVIYFLVISSLLICHENVRQGWSSGMAEATNGHGGQLEGRDRHHHERGGHIRRDLNHCWRRYDGYNLQSTMVNKKEQLKKPYGILCNFKCTWFFTINFPTCEFIYDYKLSCYLFTSLPDCTNVKCTLLNFFT